MLLLACALWAYGVWGPDDHWAAEVPRATIEANTLLNDGRPSEALARLDSADYHRQPGLDTLLVRGFAAIGSGDRVEAEEALLGALQIQGRDPQVWLGLCLLSALGPVHVKDPCGWAVELGDLEPECLPFLSRAVNLLADGLPTEAHAELEKCRLVEPSSPALANLNPLMADARVRREAHEASGSDAEHRPDGSVLDACVQAAEGGKPELVEELCARVDRRFPARSRELALNALGLSRLRGGHFEEAEEAFAECVALHPSDGALWFDAALSAAALDRVKPSLERLRVAARLDPKSVDVKLLRQDEALAAWRAHGRVAAALDRLEAGQSP